MLKPHFIYPRNTTPLEIYSFLNERCKGLGWKRGELMQRLGYANVSGALRNYDEFCEGDFRKSDLLNRLSRCEELAGEEFNLALQASRDRITRAFEQETEEARRNHIPHLWYEHVRTIPSPIFVVAIFGISTFKVIPIPKAILELSDHAQRLERVRAFVKRISELTGDKRPSALGGPFGHATAALYRDTYDHSFVISLQGDVIGEREVAPSNAKAIFRIR